jgi:hypothetical protein
VAEVVETKLSQPVAMVVLEVAVKEELAGDHHKLVLSALVVVVVVVLGTVLQTELLVVLAL